MALLSNNSPRWAMSDYGIICNGSVSVTVYPTLLSTQIEYILSNSDSKAVFVENQEQLDKILKIWDRLPKLEKVIVFEPYFPKDLPNVSPFLEFIETGIDNGFFEKRIEASKPEEVISFIYTSGTTGYPKAGVINNHNVISAIRHLPDMIEVKKDDISIAYLPLAHIAERLIGHFIKLVYGNETVFAESIKDMPEEHPEK